MACYWFRGTLGICQREVSMLIHLEAVFVPRVLQVQLKQFLIERRLCNPDGEQYLKVSSRPGLRFPQRS